LGGHSRRNSAARGTAERKRKKRGMKKNNPTVVRRTWKGGFRNSRITDRRTRPAGKAPKKPMLTDAGLQRASFSPMLGRGIYLKGQKGRLWPRCFCSTPAFEDCSVGWFRKIAFGKIRALEDFGPIFSGLIWGGPGRKRAEAGGLERLRNWGPGRGAGLGGTKSGQPSGSELPKIEGQG